MPIYTIRQGGKIYEIQAKDESSALGAIPKDNPAMADARKRVASTPGGVRAMSQGATLGAAGLYDAASAAAETGLTNFMGGLKGKKPAYGMKDAFNAVRTATKDASDEYSKTSPVPNIAYGLLGGLNMPGSSALGEFTKPAAKGLLGGVEAMGRSGLTGASLGGLYGAATARPGEEWRDMGRGEVVGGITGMAVPPTVALADKAASGVMGAGRTAARAINKASGGQLLDPQREVGKRLAESLRADKFTEPQIREVQNEWLKNGVTPTFLDIISQGGGGQNTRALVRAAALGGGGRNVAAKYNDQISANLQDSAIDLAHRLTPDMPQSAPALRSELDGAVRASDDALYPAFKADQVATQDIGDALAGDTGHNALMAARKIADARRDFNAVQEIDALVSGQADQVSAGTLDMIRQGLRDSGQEATQGGSRTLGSALTGRAGNLRESLLKVPGFKQATEASSALRGQMDAIDVGSQGLTARPDQFLQDVGQLPPDAMGPAGVGYRQAITDQIGAPAEGSTGALNKLATNTNQGRNLEAVFGAEPTESFRGGIGNLVDQVKNAQFINPNVGSQSMGRSVDERLVENAPIPRTWLGVISSAIEKVRRGATLTDAEREALVQLATSQTSAPEVTSNIARPAQQQLQQLGSRVAPAAAISMTARER